MARPKVLTIFGTRPEAIKMALLVRALNESGYLEHKTCITAQHREMLDQILDFFAIVPDYDLNIMQAGQDLFDVSIKVLHGLKEVFKAYRPDLILVHGDTSTTFISSLAAFYAGIPVGHVEAGLRTYNMQAPFPEEGNRVLTSRLAKWHFSPTQNNRANLLKEGISVEAILVTGNTVIDALLYASQKITGFSAKVDDERLKQVYRGEGKILLVTGHRRENFGQGFLDICSALKTISEQFPDLNLVYPVHLNPNVQEPVYRLLNERDNIILTKPLDYPDFVYAMKNSWALLTDSGGVQEEGPSLGKPVLVMRDTTERPEALEAGTVSLVGSSPAAIVQGVTGLLTSPEKYKAMSKAHNPYGDGKAVERIVRFLEQNM